jgi:TPR repeat protein
MNNLAEAYAAGDLVERDYTEAYRWLAVLTAKSNEVTTENLMASISKKMSQSEMASARAKAAESVKKYVTEEDRENKEYMKTLKGR